VPPHARAGQLRTRAPLRSLSPVFCRPVAKQHVEADPGVDTARGVRSSDAPAASPLRVRARHRLRAPSWHALAQVHSLSSVSRRGRPLLAVSPTAQGGTRRSYERPAPSGSSKGRRSHAGVRAKQARRATPSAFVGRGTWRESGVRSGTARAGCRRHVGCVTAAAEQGDEADEGRLELERGLVGGSRHGVAVTMGRLERSRPSRLIPGVRRT